MMMAGSNKASRRELHEEFANDWSVTGYKYAYFKTGVRKFAWILLLILATAVSAYLFSSTIIDFLTYETYIVNSIEYTDDAQVFPTITFCNFNPQTPKRAREDGTVASLKEYKEIYEIIVSNNQTFRKNRQAKLNRWLQKHNIKTFKDAIQKLEMSYADMTTKKSSHRVRDDSCQFDNKACLDDDIVSTMSWQNSLCYQFNPYTQNGESKNTSKTGMVGGLSLFLDLGSDEAEMSSYPFNGMEIIINPYGVPHMIGRHNKGVFVQPGTMNAISITLTRTTLLPAPYETNCSSQEYSIIQNAPYSKPMCEIDCVLRRIVKECNCVGFEFEGLVGDIPTCTIEEMGCYLSWRGEPRFGKQCRDELKKVPKRCKDICTRSCESEDYSVIVTQATLGNNQVYDKLKGSSGIERAKAKEYISENVVGFRISFSSLDVHTSTVTAAATWISLLADIGGNLGLCMGLSFLTFFELLFYVFDYLRLLIKKACPAKDDTPPRNLYPLG